MNKLIYLILLLPILFGSSNIFGQQYYNNLYDFDGNKEFSREIHLRENGNIVSVGGMKDPLEPNNVNSTGRLIRELDEVGNLIWQEFVAHDTIGLYAEGKHTSFLHNDSILILFAGSGYVDWINNIWDGGPYFLKYNLNNQTLLDLKFYPVDTVGTIFSTVLHTDGFIYGVGELWNSPDQFDKDLIFMKLDIDGNLIWQQTYDYGESERFTEIESYGNNLILTGLRSGPLFNDTESFIFISDTAGTILNQAFPNLIGVAGTIEIEILDNEIYFICNSEAVLIDGWWSDIQYIAKFDENLNIIWDEEIVKTHTYEINFRRMEILNNEIIIAANILNAPEYTNNRHWSYACSYSLDGNLNWEHVYMYDPDYTHHIDDIEVADNGDLIFMGTVFNNLSTAYFNQFMWLFRTDANGCAEGLVQDTCYYTLEQYFGIDTVVSTSDYLLPNDIVTVLENPFNEVLNFNVETLNTAKMHFELIDLNGKMLNFGKVNSYNQINTATILQGIYILNIYDHNKLLNTKKLIKN